MATVNAEKIKRHARLRGLSISDLAAGAGLSRQAVYQMMRPDYQAVSSGLELVARVLDLDPLQLLRRQDSRRDRLEQVITTVELAASGDPRAFEILPGCIVDLGGGVHTDLNDLPQPIPQLLASAGEVALSLVGRSWLNRFIKRQSAWTRDGLAFFFGSDLMDASRIVRLTPEPVAAHMVFGVFEMDAFARHIS